VLLAPVTFLRVEGVANLAPGTFLEGAGPPR
jgi:hypothetical protein